MNAETQKPWLIYPATLWFFLVFALWTSKVLPIMTHYKEKEPQYVTLAALFIFLSFVFSITGLLRFRRNWLLITSGLMAIHCLIIFLLLGNNLVYGLYNSGLLFAHLFYLAPSFAFIFFCTKKSVLEAAKIIEARQNQLALQQYALKKMRR